MKNFKDFIKEKTKKNISSGWYIIKLDDGTELQTNLELIDSMEIIIGKPDERKSKKVKLDKDNIIKSIESNVPGKLNLSDKKLQDFLQLYPCPCEVK